jgi:AcrR family transcriptional regulator
MTQSNGKQAEILNAAVRIFEQKGYHGASMQDLADAVGMQKASLYYYFRSKEDLLLLLCERGSGAFTQELNDIATSALAPTDKLRRAVECHLVALCAQLDLFTVVLREQKFLSPKHRARLRAEGKRHAALLESILAEGMRKREFQQLNPSVTALSILGMCNWLYEWYSPDGPLSPREIAALFSDIIVNGVRKEKKGKKAVGRKQ